MATLPHCTFKLTANVKGRDTSGDLAYKYGNFLNLLDEEKSGELIEFKIDNSLFGASLTTPIDIEIQPSYDGSVNLILNDDKNVPKLINSRFTIKEEDTYEIVDRKGDVDTNIYSNTKDKFEVDTSLLKIVRDIPILEFLGIDSGGKMPVGNYTFYFKYADADGNETDFVSESGKVICHIGKTNDPSSIRGGLLDENSKKIINFRLSNIDLTYAYINIYYTRSTGDGSEQQNITAHYINSKFKIKSQSTDITITGFEEHNEIPLSDINTSFQLVNTVKTQTQVQNMLFFGNITNDYDVFTELEDLSLRITPRISKDENIGNLTNEYTEKYNSDKNNGWEYYNANNIYYRLGYWDEEIYRFGIVYILNNYSLSPVFNIRGIKELSEDSNFVLFPAVENDTKIPIKIKIKDDNSIEGDTLTNSKGVFKINCTTNDTFKKEDSIKPIGIGINIPECIIDDSVDNNTSVVRKGLKSLTKGFFLVRQMRNPDIIAQSVSIGNTVNGNLPIIKTSNVGYITQSFLEYEEKEVGNGKNILSQGDFIKLSNDVKNKKTYVTTNAALCPEINIRTTILNQFFNSSDYKLKYSKYQPQTFFSQLASNDSRFCLNGLQELSARKEFISKISYIAPGIDLTTDGVEKFSSKAGDAELAYKTEDVFYGDVDQYTDSTTVTEEKLSESIFKVRGEFNGYLGLGTQVNDDCRYLNIYKDDYNFEANWKNYFKVRYDDSSTFQAISDRFDWSRFKDTSSQINITDNRYPTHPLDYKTFNSIGFYRGDCYICTYTHRMNWNFIDSAYPTNHKIVDKYSWSKNYKVIKTDYKSLILDDTIDVNSAINDPTDNSLHNGLYEPITSSSDIAAKKISYKRLVPLFTPKGSGILEPTDKKYKKYSETNGTFGYEQINRPDVNAVPLGHWVTFKICSNVNLSMRDLDSSNPAEEAVHKVKRGFFPLQQINRYNHLPESGVLNSGISKTLSDKYYFEIPDVPFLKTQFHNRIMYSDIHINDAFKNGYQVFKTNNYQDYTMNYGAIVKLIDWFGTIICVTENGVLQIPVNERAMMTNASGENVYINTENVLPKNPRVLSETFGSTWKDSIVKTSRFIYGIDTKGKKIWRIAQDGSFSIISDLKVQKFLNDNIDLKESNKHPFIGFRNVKTHYNAFKQDVMFTFVNGFTEWNLCYNELLDKFTTKYSWIPGYSENINNIFYTFDNNMIKNITLGAASEIMNNLNFDYNFNFLLYDNIPFLKDDKLSRIWKHGFAGIIDDQLDITPTKWYNTQEKFSFEFVVIGVQGVQKIFDNLKLISNKAKPESFTYEIVGESYNWHDLKSDIFNLNETDGVLSENYKSFLIANQFDRKYSKVPFIDSYYSNLSIKNNKKTNEQSIRLIQPGKSMSDPLHGRIRGNMHYIEDSWDVQIQPITFKYAYLNKSGDLDYSKLTEMRIRDKYVKIKVEYSGEDLAIITAIRTLFTISYS